MGQFRLREQRIIWEVKEWQNCIVCGHCVAVCPTGAVEHSGFPAGKVHEFDYSDYPVPAQMMLLCKARRSNRAFTAQSVPEELLQQILERTAYWRFR